MDITGKKLQLVIGKNGTKSIRIGSNTLLLMIVNLKPNDWRTEMDDEVTGRVFKCLKICSEWTDKQLDEMIAQKEKDSD